MARISIIDVKKFCFDVVSKIPFAVIEGGNKKQKGDENHHFLQINVSSNNCEFYKMWNP